jgi:hypothetical protein
MRTEQCRVLTVVQVQLIEVLTCQYQFLAAYHCLQQQQLLFLTLQYSVQQQRPHHCYSLHHYGIMNCLMNLNCTYICIVTNTNTKHDLSVMFGTHSYVHSKYRYACDAVVCSFKPTCEMPVHGTIPTHQVQY